MAIGALTLELACSTKTPNSPNFQAPLQTIVAANPTLTYTATSSPTNTPTVTFTPTNTATTTPYAIASPWTGFVSIGGIAVYSSPTPSANDGIFVADIAGNTVEKFFFNGALNPAWGDGGKGKGKISFLQPQALAVDATGKLYVVGGATGVYEYDALGNFLNQYSTASFSNPQGVAVDGSGNIFVSDTGNQRIIEMNASGALVPSWGGAGAITFSSGATFGPLPVTLTGSITLAGLGVQGNSLYVVTQGKGINGSPYDSLLVFDIPSAGVTNIIPGFNHPTGLTFDTGNNLYVADAGNQQIEEFTVGDFNLPPVVFFNNGGSLNSPLGVGVNAGGMIYVTDKGTNQINIFAP